MSTELSGTKSAARAGLAEFIGQNVEVISMEGHDRYTDVGALEAFDAPWVNIRKKSGELLVFSVYNVRLIKLSGK